MRLERTVLQGKAANAPVSETPGTAWFERFEAGELARLRTAFISTFGQELGAEVASDVAVYAWEHRGRLAAMDHPSGYLFRVGQSALRRHLRWARGVSLPAVPAAYTHDINPDLPDALRRLSERQRAAVVLVHVTGWTLDETAEALGISVPSVRTHLARGLDRLRRHLRED